MKHFIIFIYIIFSLSCPLIAQTYYVSQGGNDNNNGNSVNTAFATVNHAIGLKQANQTLIINVVYGTYNQPVNITQTESASYPIIIQANTPTSKPTFYGSVSALDAADAVFSWSTGKNYITIDGINIFNVTADATNDGLDGIWIRGSNNTIKNCELSNMNRSGIVVQGDNNVIDNNYVHDITGMFVNGVYKKGNNIDIETYYGGNVTSNNNIVKNNKLTNNPTHFGVNIFPDTGDPSQPTMSGNKVYNNYIDNTGGGIYTRYQVNFEIVGNVIINSTYNSSTTWDTQGGGILFDNLDNNNPRTVYGANIKIYNNTIANNVRYGIENNTSNNLYIKNNIITDNGNWLINFQILTIDATSQIDYNWYYGSADWNWGTEKTTFAAWRSACNGDGNGHSGVDPLFIGSGNDPYSIQLHSPVKNSGVPLPEVSQDIKGINRPYWNNGVDIGAYELDEAQFRIGVINTTGSPQITHNIQAVGTYWEKSSSSWVTSTATDIATSNYQTTGNSSSDQEAWDGFHLKWVKNSTSEQPFGHALYKVSNTNNSSVYFYLDYRDAIINYNPNIYIEYDGSNHQYNYVVGGTPHSIINSSVLRIWDLNNNSTSNTSGLTDYWIHSLVCVNKSNNPFLIFGPYTDPSNVLYYEIQKILDISGYSWEDFVTAGLSMTYQDVNESLVLGRYTHSVAYRVAAHMEAGPPFYSNSDSLAIVVNGPHLKLKGTSNNSNPVDYSLTQNYPNPFNPSTSIQYSIKDPGLVKLQVYDILGREVETLVNEEKLAGNYEVYFTGHHLSSGVYLYKLTAGTYSEIRKMQYLK